MLGWPHKNGDLVGKQILWDLRKELEDTYDIKHKYREDNDLFMVIGEIAGFYSFNKWDRDGFRRIAFGVEKEAREYLRKNPLDVELNFKQTFLAQYVDETLAIDTTNPFSLGEPGLTSSFIESLYL